MTEDRSKGRQLGRKKGPSGKDLAERAKGVKLDKKRTAQGVKNGKKVKFTARGGRHIISEDDLELGTFVGILETEHEGDESDLPPGTYNLHLAVVDGELVGYAESEGQIIAKAARITRDWRGVVTDEDVPAPEFHDEGWLVTCFLLLALGLFALFEIQAQQMPQQAPLAPGTPVVPMGLAEVGFAF